MKRFATLTVIGRDKTGVVARITNFLFLQKANLEALEEQVTRGQFSMTVQASWRDSELEPGNGGGWPRGPGLARIFHRACSRRRKEADSARVSKGPPPYVGGYRLVAFLSGCEICGPGIWRGNKNAVHRTGASAAHGPDANQRAALLSQTRRGDQERPPQKSRAGAGAEAFQALFDTALDGHGQRGELGIIRLDADKSGNRTRRQFVERDLHLDFEAVPKTRTLGPELQNVQIRPCGNLEILSTFLINHQRLID